MTLNPTMKFMTRREMLQAAAGLTGGALAARFFPAAIVHAATPGFPQQAPAGDQVAAMRAQFGGMPIQAQKLTDSITLLSGPGGNVVVLNGADGKLMGDNVRATRVAASQGRVGCDRESAHQDCNRHALAFRSFRQQRGAARRGRNLARA